MSSPASLLHLSPEEAQVYTQLFRQADTESIGVVTGEQAVPFFGKSKLSSAVLRKIWEISDYNDQGFLTKEQFFVALKLIAVAQAALPITLASLRAGTFRWVTYGVDTPLPFLEDVYPESLRRRPIPPKPPRTPTATTATTPKPAPPPPSFIEREASLVKGLDLISPEDGQKYAHLFQTCGPENGELEGSVARAALLQSGLPVETLAHIWSICDQTNKGSLTLEEFSVAMHIIRRMKEGSVSSLPHLLPKAYFQISTSSSPSPSSALNKYPPSTSSVRIHPPLPTPPLPASVSGGGGGVDLASAFAATKTEKEAEWDVSAEEKGRYDRFFEQLDVLRTGQVSVDQAAQFFRLSGLADREINQIAHISNINKGAYLSSEEFAVAMHLIYKALAGTPPPPSSSLPPSLIPPSLRPTMTTTTAAKPSQMESRFSSIFAIPEEPGPVSTVKHSGRPSTDLLEWGNSSLNSGSDFLNPNNNPPKAPTTTAPANDSFIDLFDTTPKSSDVVESSARSVKSATDSLPADLFGVASDSPSAASRAIPTPATSADAKVAEIQKLQSTILEQQKQNQQLKMQREQIEAERQSLILQQRDLNIRLAQAKSQYDLELKLFQQAQEAYEQTRATVDGEREKVQKLEKELVGLEEERTRLLQKREADLTESKLLKERLKQATIGTTAKKQENVQLEKQVRLQSAMVAAERERVEKMATFTTTAPSTATTATTSAPSTSPTTTTRSINFASFFSNPPPAAAPTSNDSKTTEDIKMRMASLKPLTFNPFATTVPTTTPAPANPAPSTNAPATSAGMALAAVSTATSTNTSSSFNDFEKVFADLGETNPIAKQEEEEDEEDEGFEDDFEFALPTLATSSTNATSNNTATAASQGNIQSAMAAFPSLEELEADLPKSERGIPSKAKMDFDLAFGGKLLPILPTSSGSSAGVAGALSGGVAGGGVAGGGVAGGGVAGGSVAGGGEGEEDEMGFEDLGKFPKHE